MWQLWGNFSPMYLGSDDDQGALRIGDFNGDGKSDAFAHRSDGTNWVAISTGSSFAWQLWGVDWPFDIGTDDNQGALRIGDFKWRRQRLGRRF